MLLLATWSWVRCLSLLYLLCLSIWRTAWHARASVFCHRENPMQTTYTNTRICAPIMQIFESDKWTENQLQICISVNCGTISAPHALPIIKKKPQKYFVSMKSWNSLFLCLFSKTISLIFRKSIYALSMPTCSTPPQSCIKFQKKSLVKFVFSAKSTHTLWLFLNKQINQSVEETISCNSRPKASD